MHTSPLQHLQDANLRTARAAHAHGGPFFFPTVHQSVQVDDLLLEPGTREAVLGESAARSLAQWVAGWLDRDPNRLVVMAGGHDLPGASQRSRMRALRDALYGLGVPRENIKYTERRVNLPADAAETGAGAIWLKSLASESASSHIRSVANCFAAPKGGR